MKRICTLISGCAFFFVFLIDVRADYIDPSVMTYAIQAIAGIVIALSTVFGLFLSKLRKATGRTQRYEETESDQLEFSDPGSGTVKRTEVPETPKKEAKKKRKRLSKYSWILSFALSFMMFLYEPIQLYFTNVDEFRYGVGDMLPWLLLMFFAAALVMGLVFMLAERISPKLWTCFFVLAMMLFLAMYVQGTLLIKDLPAAEGGAIDWSGYSAQRTQSLVLWIGAVLLNLVLFFVLKRTRYLQVSKAVLLGITAVLAVTLVVSCVMNNGLKAKTYNLRITNDLMDTYSKEQNLIILIPDAVDASVFAHLMETDDPDFKETFRDFTFFPDTMSGYPYTRNSVPFLLSGKWYENESPFEEYSTEAYKQAPLFRDLLERDYAMTMYEDDFVCEDPFIFSFRNIINSSYGIDDPIGYMMNILRFDFFMFMPYQLKPIEPYAVYNLLYQKSQYNMFSYNNMDFYDWLETHDFKETEEKRFAMIHIQGAHLPFRYDKHMNEIPDEDHPTYEGNVEASMTLMEMFLRRLKDAGLYDCSAVLIMADHGFARYNNPIGRQNPLLLIKGVNESHDFTISDKSVSHEDLQTAYRQLLDGAAAKDLFAENDPHRTRRYLFYNFLEPELEIEYLLKDARANETEKMTATGTEYHLDEKFRSSGNQQSQREEGTEGE